MSSNKKNKSQIIVKIIALILAGLMVLTVAGTLVYYLFTM